MQRIDEEEIDPLDEYMQEIEGEAAPQMDLPKTGNKASIITFEDIITRISTLHLEPQNNTAMEEEEYDDDFKKQFIKAINNLEEIKGSQGQKGVLMENNEEKEEEVSDFAEEEEPELDFFAKQRKMAERKELGMVDHSKIEYEEVKFNLYRESE